MDGKGPGVADVATYKPNTDVKDYKSHVAMDDAHIAAAMADPDDTYYPKRRGIDFYHHYKEDLKLFAEMGFTMLRVSLHGPASSHRRGSRAERKGPAVLQRPVR